MNEIKLKGTIRDIQPSHIVGDVEYDKANLIVRRNDIYEDVIGLRFKKFTNTYKEDQEISLLGNVRSYSRQTEDGKNKVDIYVFTYFDVPEEELEDNRNVFNVDGRICKLDGIRTLENGKKNIHFILANNLVVGEDGQKLNSYLPCIAWGNVAKQIEKLSVNTKICVHGRLQSREYRKKISDTEFELRVAHEVYVESFEVLE